MSNQSGREIGALAIRIVAVTVMFCMVMPGSVVAYDVPVAQEPVDSLPVNAVPDVNNAGAETNLHGPRNAVQRILVPRLGDYAARLQHAGARVLHEYESFVLADCPDSGISGIESAGLAPYPVDRTISMDSVTFTPSEGIPDIPGSLEIDAYPPGQDGYFIVQFMGPVDPVWRSTITDMGADIMDYIPHNSYVVRMNSDLETDVDRLPFVDWVGIYQPAYKIHGILRNITGVKNIRVLTQGAPDSLATASYGTENTLFNRWNLGNSIEVYDISADTGSIQSLACDNDVYWIEPYYDYELDDEVSCEIVGGSFPGPGTYINDLGYDGTGAVVAVADTGIDDGINATMHLDLAGRVDNYFWYGSATDAGDGYGHGTHCAGIVAGDASAGSMDSNGFYYGYGVAPKAHLVAQKIFSDLGSWLGVNYNDLGHDAITAGANIGSNSWGANTFGDYNADCAAFDGLVRDADNLAPGSQQYTLVFSSGNAGPGSGTVGSPGSAKNVICTGSSENDRPAYGSSSDNIEQVSSFSSRGPCADGRYKPDITAPGGWIASALSTSAPAGWAYGQVGTYYEWCSGTSMACPHTSGGAAVFFEYYSGLTGSKPSPALTKSALINGADDMLPGGGTLPIPNNDEGWGRMNLTNVVGTDLDHKYQDQNALLTTGQSQQYVVDVLKNTAPLRITMAYTDAPAAASANPALVNNLDITVTAPDGTKYHGNQMSGGWSTPNPAGFDAINNVECVYIQTPQVGQYFIDVIALNVPVDGVPDTPAVDQDFAITMSGLFGVSQRGTVTFDRNSYLSMDSATVEVTDLGLNVDPNIIDTATVDVNSTTELAPETLVVYETGVNTSVFSGNISLAPGAPMAGDGVVQVTDGGLLVATYYDADDGTGAPFTAVDTAFINDIHDVAVFNIDSPANGKIYPTAPVSINATVENNGITDSFDARYEIGTISYVNHVAFFDDMENGTNGWTHQWISGIAPDLWSMSNFRSNSSLNSWHSGFEPGSNWGDSALISPTIDLTGSTNSHLTFWHWYNFFDWFPIDGGIVEVFDGSTWTQITPVGGYDALLASGWLNPLEGAMAFTYNSTGWKFEDFNLSAYDGTTIQIRFHVGWNSINDGPTEGWYIDDVKVSSTQIIKTILDQGNDSVINLPPHGTRNVFGNAFTFTFESTDYYMDVETLLPGDEDTANDLQTAYFTVANIHDAAVDSVNYPSEGMVCPLGPQTINVTVHNNGTLTDTFDVECIVRDSFNNTVYNRIETVSNLPYGDSMDILFSPPWNAAVEDTYTVFITASLTSDTDPSNDWKQITFILADIEDVGVGSVISPAIGSTYPLGSVNIDATVRNFGNVPESFTANYTIGTVNLTTVPVFSDDFESGGAGWTTTGNFGIFDQSDIEVISFPGGIAQPTTHSFTVPTVPAAGSGTIYLDARDGDFNSLSEYIDVYVESTSGTYIGRGQIGYQNDPNWRPIPPHQWTVTAAQINSWAADGNIDVVCTYSSSVNDLWGSNEVRIRLEYSYGTQSDWEYGTPAFGDITSAHSGLNCFGTNLTNNYAANSEITLTSPSIDFSGTSSEKLSFWHTHDFYSTEAGGIVEVSTDNSTWTKIDPITGNLWYSSCAAFSGANAFTGDPYRPWYRSTFDMSPFSGNSDVRIRFKLKSTSNPICNEGWYIDDVVVTSQILVVNNIIDWGDQWVSNMAPGEERRVFGNSYTFTSEEMYMITVKTLLPMDENNTNNITSGLFTIQNIFDVGVAAVNSPTDGGVYGTLPVEINATVENYGNVPASFIMNYTLGNYTIADSSIFMDDFESGAPGWTSVSGVKTYTKDFETATGTEWTTYESTARGRNQRDTYTANTGAYSWRMDVTSIGNNLNELILYLDVTGASYLNLDFSTREYGDEQSLMPASFFNHANGDGIAVSTDNLNWYTLWQYPSFVGAWTAYGPFDVGGQIPINGNVYIKFQQYDNFPVPTDGIFWDDIQVSTDGLIIDSGSASWSLGTPAYGDVFGAYSGVNCWGTELSANYMSSSTYMLTSPSIDLSNGSSNEYLTFWHTHDFYFSEAGGIVEISTDNSTWTKIDPTSGNLWYSNCNAFGGARAFTGDPYRTWYQSTFDMSPFSGNSDVRVRFVMNSTSFFIRNEGWYIDDVEVRGLTLTGTNVLDTGEEWVSNLMPGVQQYVFGNTYNFTQEEFYWLNVETRLVNDGDNTNNLSTSLFEIYNFDDIGVQDILPFRDGNIYPTGNYSINATLRNNGNYYATGFNVTCEIRDGGGTRVYSDAVTVTDTLLPGQEYVIDFSPIWAAFVEENYSIFVYLNYAIDEDPSNDALMRNFTIDNINDVGVLAITSLTDGMTYTTGSYNVSILLANFGNVRQYGFDTLCTIRDSAGITVYSSTYTQIGYLNAGEVLSLTFPDPWNAFTEDQYFMDCFTTLATDEDMSNNATMINLTIDNIPDAGVMSINSHLNGNTYPTGQQKVTATIRSYGNIPVSPFTAACYVINAWGNLTYYDEETVPLLLPGETIDLGFSPYWDPNTEGMYEITVETLLVGDENPVNDVMTITVEINNVYDIGVTSIEPLVDGGTYRTGTYGIQAAVMNFGNVPVSGFEEVYFEIDDSFGTVYSDTVILGSGLLPGESLTLTVCDSWNASVEDFYSLRATTTMLADENTANDGTVINLEIDDVYDAAIQSMDTFTHLGTYTTGTYTLNITVANPGHLDIVDMPVECRIETLSGVTVYDSQFTIASLQAGTTQQVSFAPDWSVGLEDSYTIDIWLTLPGDENPSNDQEIIQIFIDDYYDSEALGIEPFMNGMTYPTGSYAINGTVKNSGNVPITGYDTSLRIVDSFNTQVYFSQAVVSSVLQPGQSANVTFAPSWDALLPGIYSVRFTSLLIGDENTANDIYEVTIRIEPGHDVGATTIPTFINGTTHVSGQYSIETRVKNWGQYAEGNVTVSCDVRDFNGTLVYSVIGMVPAISPGEVKTIIFNPPWNVSTEGNYTIEVYTMLASDEVDSNNLTSLWINIDDFHDAAVTSTAPFAEGMNYAAGTYRINATLGNPGTADEGPFTVNCTVLDSGNATVYASQYNVTSLVKGGILPVSFGPNWTVVTLGNYTLVVTVMLPGDENSANDVLTVHFRIESYSDIDIIGWTPFVDGGIYPTGTYTINVTVENRGLGVVPLVIIICDISDPVNGSVYTTNALFFNLNPGEKATGTFTPAWNTPGETDYNITFTSFLADDNMTNNQDIIHISIDEFHDMAAVSSGPFTDGGTYGLGTYPIDAVIMNNGTMAENNVTVNCTIRDSMNIIVFFDEYVIPSIGYGAAVPVSFDTSWNAAVEGQYTISVTTLLAGDEENTNNLTFVNFSLDEMHDVSVIDAGPFMPYGTYQTGNYTLTAEILNSGTIAESNVPVNCTVRDGSGSIVYWSDLVLPLIASGANTTVIFPYWLVNLEGSYTLSVTTGLPTDEAPGNDVLGRVFYIDEYHDIGIIDQAPFTDGNVYRQGNYSLEATVVNAGTIAETGISVTCAIYDSSFNLVYWANSIIPLLDPGQNTTVTFGPDWAVNLEGGYSIYMSTSHPGDENPANDADSISILVDEYHDIMVLSAQPFVDLGLYPAGTYTLSVMLMNNGTIDEGRFDVSCIILDSLNQIVYRTNLTTGTVVPGGFLNLTFSPDWTPSGDDSYTMIVLADLLSDENTDNNQESRLFYIDMTAPAADPGKDDTTFEDMPYSFDGSGSYDNHGIANYTWEFGDGQTGYGISPNHTYYFQGVYMVNLTVTDMVGLTSTATMYLTVLNPIPVAIAGPDTNVLEGTVVDFNGSGSWDNPSDMPWLTYTWWFGDGFSATGISPWHIYNESGVFTVTLEVMDDDGDVDYDTLVITVQDAAPVADIGGPYSDLEGAVIFFDASASYEPGNNIVLYEWDWDNDGVYDENSTIPTAIHVWYSPGAYPISLKVTDSDGSVDTVSAAVDVLDVAPVAVPGGPYSGNEGGMIVVNASGSFEPGDDIVLYEWDLDNDGSFEVSGSSPEANLTRNAPGTYIIRLRVTDEDGSTGTDSTAVNVLDVAPTADAGGPYIIQEGGITYLDASGSFEPGDDIILYEWDMDGDGVYDESSVNSLMIAWWDSPGSFTVILRVTDEDGSTGTGSAVALISDTAPVADLSGPYQGMEGQTILFDADASREPGDDIILYEWDWNNDGIYDTNTTVSSSSHEWYTPGEFTLRLRVTDEDGSSDVTTAMVTINNVAPTASAGGPYSAQEGTTVLLDASASSEIGNDIMMYEWDFESDGIFDALTTDPTYSWTCYSAGLHTIVLKVTDTDGSCGMDTTTANIIDVAPTADVGGPYADSEGESVRIDASATTEPGNNIVLYEWDWDNDGTIDESGQDDVVYHIWEKPGIYSLRLRVTDGDGSTDEVVTSVDISDVAPTAVPGGPYVIDEGEILIIDGSGSTEPGDDIILYEWDLDGDMVYEISSVSPFVIGCWNSSTELDIHLRVTDEDGSTGTANTTITVRDIAPSAQPAGSYQGKEGQVITFSAEASREPGNNIVSYEWDWDNDGIYDDTSRLPEASHIWYAPGTYTIRLRVTDTDGSSDVKTTSVSVQDIAPTAIPGGPYTSMEGQSVNFNASGSTEPGDDIQKYEWDMNNDGIYDIVSTGPLCTYVWYEAGTQYVLLRVTDYDGSCTVSMVSVSVEDVPPTAVLASGYSVDEGVRLFLDASGSSEPGNNIVQYKWDWNNDGIIDELTSVPWAQNTWFEPGAHTIGLTVVDSDGSQARATSVVTVNDLVDSDRDGFPDEWEVAMNTDPYDGRDEPIDTDGDGIPDGDAANSQSWMDTDDDNDGVPDSEDPAPLNNSMNGKFNLWDWWWLILIILAIILLAFVIARAGSGRDETGDEPEDENEAEPEDDRADGGMGGEPDIDITQEVPARTEAPDAPVETAVPASASTPRGSPPTSAEQPPASRAVPVKPMSNQAKIAKIEQLFREGKMSKEVYVKNMHLLRSR